MSQASAAAGGDNSVPLFACTKCYSRHPFEELSKDQLCKSCRGSFQTIKCNYCRSEFQQDANNNKIDPNTHKSSGSNAICSNCERLCAKHGKPGPCSYCNIIAAYIGTKCQRCTNSEKKYGAPLSCEHCKQKCAFDRKDPESKKKVGGKLLCWLCTITYKKTLAKAKQKEAILKSSASYRHRVSGAPPSSSSSSRHHSSSMNGHQQSSRHGDQLRSSSSSHHKHHRDSTSSRNKKARIDLSATSNGASGSSSTSIQISSLSTLTDGSRFIEPMNNGNDLAAVVAQLKDQVAMLNKRLQMKEKDLLAKDKQIAEMKSSNGREQREFREKINSLEKQHKERISEMQSKLVTMQKQIATQTRSSRPTPKPGYIEPPLVI